MPKSMVSAEHYNTVKLERDGLAARVARFESWSHDYSEHFGGHACSKHQEDLLTLMSESSTQSLLIHDAEALEHWAKVLSSSLVEGVPVHRMMSEAASLRLQAEDAKK